MKAWLENRMIAPGVLDMSVSAVARVFIAMFASADRQTQNLPNDEWIKSNGIFPPGHPHAPPTAGLVFWRLIDQTFQKVPLCFYKLTNMLKLSIKLRPTRLQYTPSPLPTTTFPTSNSSKNYPSGCPTSAL